MAVRLVVRRTPSSTTDDDGGNGVHYEFEQARLVIGRSASCDLRLPALTVSDLHATLEQSGRGYTLLDMRSTNGTRVNGTALVPDRGRALHDGDVIELGEFRLEFHLGGPVSGLTSPERTVSLAKRLLRENRSADAPSAATLQWSWGEHDMGRLTLPQPPARWMIGAAEDAELHIDDPAAPPALLELELSLDGLSVREQCDVPITINGKPSRRRTLRDGDALQCGALTLRFDDPADRALRALEGAADAPLEATIEAPVAEAKPPEASPVAADGTPAPAPETPLPGPEAKQSVPPAKPSVGPDAVVYALAFVLLAASAVGMLWLLGD